MLAELEGRDLLGDTLVIFTSDNGPPFPLGKDTPSTSTNIKHYKGAIEALFFRYSIFHVIFFIGLGNPSKKNSTPGRRGSGPDHFLHLGGGSKSDHFSYFQKLKKKQVVFKISLDHVIFVRENKSQNYSTHFAMGGSHPSIEFSTHFFMGSHHHSKPQ